MGARDRVGIRLSYGPSRLHRLAELIPWNRFLGSKLKNSGSSVWLAEKESRGGEDLKVELMGPHRSSDKNIAVESQHFRAFNGGLKSSPPPPAA
jgi:hypothetical protein